MESEADKIETRPVDAKLKIFFLPNLMTAGNLFCGFTATLKIVEGALITAAAAGDPPCG